MSHGGPHPTPWQARCLRQLKASAAGQPELLQITGTPDLDENVGYLHVPIRLNTEGLARRPGGLPLRDFEDFVVAIGPGDDRPPVVYVQHFRFLGHPHVLSGFMICLYLDESREWDPGQCVNGQPNGVLNRLWRWLEKAALRQFNADEALYHAVGGIPHISRQKPPLPPILVRDLPVQRGQVASAWLTLRSPWCLELSGAAPSDLSTAEHIPIFFPNRDLPFGAGHDYLYELTSRLDRDEPDVSPRLTAAALASTAVSALRPCADRPCPAKVDPPLVLASRPVQLSPATAMLTALAASASRKAAGTPQTLLLAVPHPVGGPRHLIAVYFEAALGDKLRQLVAKRTSPLISFDQARLDRATPLRWCYVSDERPEVTKRRDIGRPVTAYQGATVVVWGVGGIGSWIAEYLTRAGASKVIVCDTGMVSGGLLVRQNYLDADIGAAKAERLVDRLKAIAPDADIVAVHHFSDEDLASLATEADLIVDATVNRVVAHRLDAVTTTAGRDCVVAHVATDARTGTLGLAIVNSAGCPIGLSAQDVAVGQAVKDSPALEPYQTFWADPEPGDEFVPTRGCSLPTFHGSAADLAAVAASLTTLIASHLRDDASGSHLIALPHSGVSPAHHYIAGTVAA